LKEAITERLPFVPMASTSSRGSASWRLSYPTDESARLLNRCGVVTGYSPPCSMVSKRRAASAVQVRVLRAFVRRHLCKFVSELHHSSERKVSCDEHTEEDGNDDSSPHQGRGPAHKSSPMPLKKGWRTLPSADFARYSISANSDGLTQTPRCAIFLA
jgi:hypothetical protein